MDSSLHSLTLETRAEREAFKSSRICEMPDDILIHILSFLTIKEAGRTNLLSKRWRYVGAYIRYLDFDSHGALDEGLMNYIHSLEETEPIYSGWVDQVVNSHKAPTVDIFKVKYDLGVSRKDNIDNWLKFAVEKRVRRLELDVAPGWGISNPLSYTFPSLLFNSLTFLRLGRVHVSGELLEKLLSDCQTLEFLSVSRSDLLVDLKVSGPSLNLKSLTILYCNEIKYLEISAPNLKFFYYEGPKISSPFKSIPKLTELNIAGIYADHLVLSEFLDLSSFISQIEVLSILPLSTIKRMPEVFPKCTMVKTLHIKINPGDDVQLFRLRFLLSACPFFHKFVLKLQLGLLGRRSYTTDRTSFEACPHYQLKILEIVDFVGCELDSAFAAYLIKSAVSLESMIIEPTISSTPWERSGPKLTERATNEAEKLRSKLKPSTAFQIHNITDRIIYQNKVQSLNSFSIFDIGGVD